MTTEFSEIDLIYPKWNNNLAVAGGTLTAMITTLALARIGKAAVSRFIEWDTNRVAQVIVLSSALALGVLSGHLITTQAIGLIAKSAMGKFSVSLTCNTLGGLAGLALFATTRSWI